MEVKTGAQVERSSQLTKYKIARQHKDWIPELKDG